MSAELAILQRDKEKDWCDWQWQMKNRIRSVEELARYICLSEAEKQSIKKASDIFPMAITPYYASLIKEQTSHGPIRLQSVPSAREMMEGCSDMEDPLHEDVDSPVPGLTHRYPDRVLLLVTNECAMYCRHCTRKRTVGDENRNVSDRQIDRGIEYIKAHPEIRDVLLSGGDPLTLSNTRLERIIRKVREIPHIEVVRIGTRTPVVMPQRITDELVNMLKKYHPLWINTHFNHPQEFTPESSRAVAKLANAGIPLGNQTVLLRGVNDCPVIMKKLVHLLVKNRIRPYYLYQCDLSRGIEHFRTPVAKGIEIMEALIGHTSGFAVPTYVIDAPGGGGKIPVLPNYLLSMSSSSTVLRNYEGVICVYAEPADSSSDCPGGCSMCEERGDEAKKPIGLQKLVGPDAESISLVPVGNQRYARLARREEDDHGGKH